MDLNNKLFVRVDDATLAWLNDEAARLRERTDLPKVGASTIMRKIAVERMNRSKGRAQ